MKRIKRLFLQLISATLLINCMINASASSPAEYVQADTNSLSDNTIMGDVNARAAILTETSTGSILADKNAHDKLPISHLAKLMTVLITAEKLDSGDLKLTDKVTVSANANSKEAPQIWLDVGESITVDELLKSITVGNANDACTALAEKIGGTESEFITLMNKKADKLGMQDTHFADVCGTDENTVSTAYDLSLLAREIVKHDSLTEYFSIWLCNVRNNAVELVSTNRLIRTYNGCFGLKSCASDKAGECLISVANKGNMSVCCVILGALDSDSKFSSAKTVMDYGFTTFQIYEPDIPDEIMKNIKVNNGEKNDVSVKVKSLSNVVIPRGAGSQIK